MDFVLVAVRRVERAGHEALLIGLTIPARAAEYLQQQPKQQHLIVFTQT